MQRQAISALQVAFLIVTARAAMLAVYLPPIAGATGHYAWLVSLAGHGAMIPLAFVVISYARRFPGKNFYEYSPLLVGKYLGYVINILYIWFFFFICVVLVHEIAKVMLTLFMVYTPGTVFRISFVYVLVVGVLAGLEVIARVNDLIIAPVVLFTGLVFAGLIGEVRLENFLPLLAIEHLPLLAQGAVFSLSTAFTVVWIGVAFSSIKDNRVLFSRVAWALVLSGIVALLVNGLIIGLFGGEQAQQTLFPGMVATRYIRVGGFIERVESIAMVVWLTTMFIKLSLFFWASAIGVAHILGLTDYRRVVSIMAALMVGLSINWLPDAADYVEFIAKGWPLHNSIFVIVVPCVLFVISLLRKGSET